MYRLIILKNDHLWSFFNIIYKFLGSILESCYIQNCVIMNPVRKKLKCICFGFERQVLTLNVVNFDVLM